MTRILGIDPGYERLGIAIIDTEGKKTQLLFSECFHTKKTLSHPERLQSIAEHLKEVIREYSPNQVGIETLFFSTNKKTALFVAEARGVILYTCKDSGVFIREFLPAHIKLAVTGHGKADKTQIMHMIPRLIRVEKEIKTDDEYDAIAIALTAEATPLPLSPQ